MDRYFYLTLSLIYLLLAVILIVRVPRLRFAAIAIGIGSAVVGPVSELLFYYKDYWHPVTLSEGRSVSIEHCIFGFSVMVVAMLLYPALRNITFTLNYRNPTFVMTITLFVISASLLWFATRTTTVNSILLSSVLFLLSGLIYSLRRRELLHIALFSATCMGILSFLVYLVMFRVWPDYLANHWLLSGRAVYGVTLFGVPLTELLWFGSLGFLGSIGYLYVFKAEISTVTDSDN